MNVIVQQAGTATSWLPSYFVPSLTVSFWCVELPIMKVGINLLPRILKQSSKEDARGQ